MGTTDSAFFELSPLFAIHRPQIAVSPVFAIHSKNEGVGGGEYYGVLVFFEVQNMRAALRGHQPDLGANWSRPRSGILKLCKFTSECLWIESG